MKLLLDVHTLLWFHADDPKLSATAKAALEDPGNERWLSPISLVEIALKVRLSAYCSRHNWRPTTSGCPPWSRGTSSR